MALYNEGSLKMDSSTRQTNLLLDPNLSSPINIRAQAITAEDWAQIIMHLVVPAKPWLKYFPDMAPVATMLNRRNSRPGALIAGYETADSVIEPTDFDQRTRCVVLMNAVTNIGKAPRCRRDPEPLLQERKVLLADTAQLYLWEAVYRRSREYVLADRGREAITFIAQSSRFTPLENQQDLAASLDLNEMTYNFLTGFAAKLDGGIRTREKSLANMRAVRNEALRLKRQIFTLGY